MLVIAGYIYDVNLFEFIRASYTRIHAKGKTTILYTLRGHYYFFLQTTTTMMMMMNKKDCNPHMSFRKEKNTH